MTTTEIDVARDFSPTPIGRYRRQGRFSGEAFREDLLLPALQRFEFVAVILDGTSGLSTGFLDEAFAGPIRERLFAPDDFRRRVSFRSERDPTILMLIEKYLDDAVARLD